MQFKSARQALIVALSNGWAKGGDGMDAAKLGTRIQTTAKNRSLDQIAHNLECGQVLSVLDRVPKAAHHWALYAYADFPGYDTRWRAVGQHINRHVRMVYAKSIASQGSNIVPAVLLMQLIPEVMRDYAALQSGGQRLYTPATFQDELGLTDGQRSNWARDFKPCLEGIETVIDALDRMALGPVAGLINEIREAEAEQAV